MKTRLVGLVLLFLGLATARAQVPTLINYQGKLIDGTNLVNAIVGLTLRLYDDPAAGGLLYEDSNTVPVVDGLYSTFLGDDTISGTLTGALASAAVYIEVEVNGVVLSPRERLVSAGYAMDAADVPGNVFWRTDGNLGTSEDTHFVGTRDNEALSFRVNDQQALRLIPATDSPQVMGGHSNNTIGSSSDGALIAGGGLASEPNRISGNAPYSVIAGGSGNELGDGSIFTERAVIGGGRSNNAIATAATVAGGLGNRAFGVQATVGGGENNTAYGSYATVAGGRRNSASNNYAAIPGGFWNSALGRGSFAAGQHAQALHNGTFVWADDSTTAFFQSTLSNQFLIRAAGGVGINMNSPATGTVTVAGTVVATVFSGSGSGLTSLNGSNVVAGTVSNAVFAQGAVTGDKIRDGTISNADVAANTFWETDGNAGTVAGTHFVGTTDSRPLELRVNNQRVILVSTDAAPNIIEGSPDNQVDVDVTAGTIGGGQGNRVTERNGTVGGGVMNTCGTRGGVISGGESNRISGTFSVIGGGSNNSSIAQFGVIAGGERIRVYKSWSAGLGGMDNIISGQYSVVVGGYDNLTTGSYSFVGGGTDNRALGPEAFVGGGSNNWAQSTATVIAGGRANRTFMPGAAIGGGFDNVVSASNGVVGGGMENNVSSLSPYATIAGGLRNSTDDPFTFVGGGMDNSAYGRGAAIGGGDNNDAAADSSFIGGGSSNSVTSVALWGTIGGGEQNRVASEDATIAGGRLNAIAANGNNGVIAGGYRNLMTNTWSHGSFIGGGYDNIVSGRWAVIAGGWFNNVGGDFAAIGGGSNNFARGKYSVVPGGRENTATGDYSFAAGRRANAVHPGAFVWADSQDADFNSTTNDEFAIRATNGVRIAYNAGEDRIVGYGQRFRDNGIIAWAKISASGILAYSFNVTNVIRTATGAYELGIGAAAINFESVIPVAIAEVDDQPTNAAGVCIVSVNQKAQRRFDVWINSLTGSPTNNDFVFMVTGR